MTTLPEFTRKMAAAPAKINAAKARMVGATALAITTTVRAEIATATHGTNRMSGVGRRGARVGARYDVKGTQNPTAIVYARGPLHLLERDVREHSVKPRRKRALASANFGPVASADKVRSKGKHPFEKGVAAGIPVGMKAANTIIADTLLKVVQG